MNKRKLVFFTGKSASGKSTLASLVLKDERFIELPMHTTRPRRYENEGGYTFETEEEFLSKINNGELIEYRAYGTNKGIWYYGTTKEDLNKILEKDKIPVIISGTPNMYLQLEPILEDMDCKIIVCYLKADDKDLLQRSIQRESKKKEPNYAEICRRFLSDKDDWSEENTSIFPSGSCYKNKSLNYALKEFYKRNGF